MQVVVRAGLYLVGEELDDLARMHCQHLPARLLDQRVARDGPSFHVTLVNKSELAALNTQRYSTHDFPPVAAPRLPCAHTVC